MIVELSEAAPVERPPFETDEATEGIEDEVGIVEEAVEDGNRSPDSIIVESGFNQEVAIILSIQSSDSTPKQQAVIFFS